MQRLGQTLPMQLPLWAYLSLSIAAIAALAVMVRRLRPGSVPPMPPERALELFRSEFPETGGAAAEMAPDGRTAIISSASGEVTGCVTLLGLRWTARRISSRDIVSVAVRGAHVTLRFADYTWPSLIIDGRNPLAAEQWAARFRAAHA